MVNKVNEVAVVIPIYKNNFEQFEMTALEQCFKVLKNHPIIFFKPDSLLLKSDQFDFENIPQISFPDSYFKSALTYNELMLSFNFYESFLDYKYILIYQLDAFVFKDDLIFWCNKNYDYVGAPWIASISNNPFTLLLNKISSIFDSKEKKERKKIFFKVGNGGFSLRKVASHYQISKENEKYIKELLISKRGTLDAIEDVFWSFKAIDFLPAFRIPDYKEALNFAIDRKPQLALKLNNNQVPFGCHGIDKPKVINFWKSYISKFI